MQDVIENKKPTLFQSIKNHLNKTFKNVEMDIETAETFLKKVDAVCEKSLVDEYNKGIKKSIKVLNTLKTDDKAINFWIKGAITNLKTKLRKVEIKL